MFRFIRISYLFVWVGDKNYECGICRKHNVYIEKERIGGGEKYDIDYVQFNPVGCFVLPDMSRSHPTSLIHVGKCLRGQGKVPVECEILPPIYLNMGEAR